MGFEKTILREGNGRTPEEGETVTVHCTGYGKNRNLSLKVISFFLSILFFSFCCFYFYF